MPVRKAVLPVAGYGTRFLPASKAMPKELVTLVDRPAIQWVVEECARAGVDDVLLVTSQGKHGLADHFDRHLELEGALESKGKDELLERVLAISDIATVTSTRQHEQLGLGHAVLMGRHHVGDDSFVVVLGDDVVPDDDQFLERMVEVHEQDGLAAVALMEVPESEVSKYGIAATEPTDDPDTVRITGLVEKPDPADAPSNLAIIGRYVLPGSIFGVLEETERGAGGEIQLTDALATLAADTPIHGVIHRGVRHDLGDHLGWLKANVQEGLRHEEMGGPLREFVAGLLEDDG